jgi:DNA-binding response OmpR family regulator
MHILLAEDDPQLGESLKAALTLDGYVVTWLTRGDAVADAVLGAACDAVLLDIGLPGRSGLDALRELRRRGYAGPVMLLTARDAVADRVAGLDVGADDYLGKPFDMDELFARLRSLLRRATGAVAPTLVAGPLEVAPGSHEVRLGGAVLALPAKQVAVLELLVRNRGRFVSRSRIEDELYSRGESVGSNTVEVYVSQLRKQLGANSIETLRGVGYRLAL